MTVKDLIAKADIDRQVEIVCREEGESDQKKVRDTQSYFINMLLSLEPKKENNFIVFEKYWDTMNEDKIEPFITPELYHKDELVHFLPSIKDIPCPIGENEYNESMTSKELKALWKRFDIFPIAYAIDFIEWEEILGTEVYEGNLEELDIQECIYSLLYEMSFNGITKEDWEERLDELTETIEKNEALLSLPEEERESHFVSWDDVKERFKEELNYEEPTVEEKEETEKKMWLCSIKSLIWKFNNLKKIIEENIL